MAAGCKLPDRTGERERINAWMPPEAMILHGQQQAEISWIDRALICAEPPHAVWRGRYIEQLTLGVEHLQGLRLIARQIEWKDPVAGEGGKRDHRHGRRCEAPGPSHGF